MFSTARSGSTANATDVRFRISVVTVAWNAAGTIGDTLASVAAQDWSDLEHIVVDGGSLDGTQEIVRRLGRPGIRMVSEPDKGCYDAMNKGLRMATGDAVLFLNADDFLARPDAIRLAAEAFLRTGADFVGGQTVIVDQNDVRKVARVYRARDFRPWMLRFGHMPPHPSFFARREKLMAVGGFDLDFRIAGDFDQMVRLLLLGRGRFVTLDETITIFRKGGISTQSVSAKMEINKEIARCLRGRGVVSHPLLLLARYPLKAMQLIGRPRDYPPAASFPE